MIPMKDIYAKTNNVCLVFLTLVAATGSLIYTKPVLIPFIFSIFVYAMMTPLVHYIQKNLKLPKTLAVFGAILTLGLVLTLLVFILFVSIENFVEGAPKYKTSLAESLAYFDEKLRRINPNFELSKVQELLQTIPFSFAQKLTSDIINFLGNMFLVFIFSIFMLIGEGQSKKKNRLIHEILQKTSSYLSSKFILSLATGILVWIVLMIFNVELALIFGLLTILLNFIPTIGSIAAVALPLPIVFLQYQFSATFFIILAITGTIQFVIGNIIEPKVMGESMDLHPITVLLCLMFWGLVWGIPGMFLAVPITAILKIIFGRIHATKIIAEVLAGRIPNKSN